MQREMTNCEPKTYDEMHHECTTKCCKGAVNKKHQLDEFDYGADHTSVARMNASVSSSAAVPSRI